MQCDDVFEMSGIIHLFILKTVGGIQYILQRVQYAGIILGNTASFLFFASSFLSFSRHR